MSDPANDDDYPMSIACEVLAKMTPAELAEAEEEARTKGVPVGLLILRAIVTLVEQADAEHEAFLSGKGRQG